MEHFFVTDPNLLQMPGVIEKSREIKETFKRKGDSENVKKWKAVEIASIRCLDCFKTYRKIMNYLKTC